MWGGSEQRDAAWAKTGYRSFKNVIACWPMHIYPSSAPLFVHLPEAVPYTQVLPRSRTRANTVATVVSMAIGEAFHGAGDGFSEIF